MAYKIDMVYTENPYVDIVIYNTKKLALETVLKMPDNANAKETIESKKNADMYIACMENTATFELFDSFSKEVLMSAGITGTVLVSSLLDKDSIPKDRRDAVLEAAKREFIENYEELNNYYRMLYGLPPVGHEDYVVEWVPPEEIVIDLSLPIHKMGTDSIRILDNYGVLEELYNEDPSNRGYLKHILRKVSPYAARKAPPFEKLFIPTIDSAEITNEFKDRLEINRQYALKAVYSDAYKYNSDYYDNFIAVFIVLMTMIDVLVRVQEFIARKEVFDARTVKYIFESYGVPYFPEIPLKYQIKMVKNLHTLLKYKSTAKCMVDICSLFGFENIEIFKYYLLRSRNYVKSTDTYSFTGDNEDDFTMQFVKVPIDGNLEDFIRDSSYRADYDEIVAGDDTWIGGLEHKDVKKQHLDSEYNYTRTKYLSVDSVYDITKVAIQQCYFFNMLYDNIKLEGGLNLNFPYVDNSKPINIANIFIFLTALTYQYHNLKDMIMDTQGKVLTIMGFNFKANLGLIASDMMEILRENGHYGSPLSMRRSSMNAYKTKTQAEEKQEIIKLLEQFNIPESSIPSMQQLMKIFTNNLDIREALVSGMRRASNLQLYNAYKYLYDSLMTIELNLDFFKNPETGDYYRDIDGDATFTEYLKHADSTLYYKLIEIQMMDDHENRIQYIASLIDNIVYVLEEYIDTEEFSGIFYNLPVVSIEAVKQYIKTIIDFYKSYKVHFLGINTLYLIDDKNECWVKVIDEAIFNIFFDKTDTIAINDRIGKMLTKLSKQERLQIIEKVYLDISTWIYTNPTDKISIKEKLYRICKMNYKESVIVTDEYSFNSRKQTEDIIELTDSITKFISRITKADVVSVRDDIRITPIT